MKSIHKTILSLIMLAVISCTGCATAQEQITVTLDGKTISFDVQPQMIDDRTLVPLRAIFEEIGALVKWDEDTQTVTARKNKKTVTLTIGAAEMQISNGKTDDQGNLITETKTLDVPAQVVSDRTMIPLRAISEIFGYAVTWDAETNTASITSDTGQDNTWKQNTGTISLTDLHYTGNGISVSGNQILITQGGDFTLSGTLSNGSITVQTEERVRLTLAEASIYAESGPCIYFEQADKAYIEIKDGTQNVLSSPNSENGAIYSKENLQISGGGTLTIQSDAGHGIKASDNLTLENGALHITAAGDGIHANDTFKMTGGSITSETTGDGIDSESIVIIEGGSLDIKTTLAPLRTSDSTSTETASGMHNPFEEDTVEFAHSSKGIKAEWMMVISGGSIAVNSTDHAIHCADEIEIHGGNIQLDSAYAKGISGHGNVTISGADTSIAIQNSTEGIESKKTLTIHDGTFRIISSDDALNGGGTQGISFEQPDAPAGMPPERQENPEMTPPENFVPSETEEFVPPVSSGNAQENHAQMPPDGNSPGRGMPEGMNQNLKDVLIINGGDIEVMAEDDCLDANGNIVLSGGLIKASEPNGTINGVTAVFDSDGTVTIGESVTFIGTAGSGSAPNFDTAQNAVTLYADETHDAGETITLKDSADAVIAEYSPAGRFSTLWILSPSLSIDGHYTLTAGSETHEFTLTEKNTSIGTQKNMTGNFGGRGPRNQPDLPPQTNE